MKWAILHALMLSFLCSTLVAAQPTSYETDFEDFEIGHTTPKANGVPLIGAADGWTGDGLSGVGGQTSYDAEIVDLNGNHVFRISNPDGGVTGNYDATHPNTPAVIAAGQSQTGVPNRHFVYSFDFMSVSDVFRDGMMIRATPVEKGTSFRQGVLRISDQFDGLTVQWSQYNPAIGTVGDWEWVDVATGLDRTQWHNVSVAMTFSDVDDGDTVDVQVNGQAVEDMHTWETFYRETASRPAHPEYASVDSVIFRVPEDGGPRGEGLYIDNVSLGSAEHIAGQIVSVTGGTIEQESFVDTQTGNTLLVNIELDAGSNMDFTVNQVTNDAEKNVLIQAFNSQTGEVDRIEELQIWDIDTDNFSFDTGEQVTLSFDLGGVADSLGQIQLWYLPDGGSWQLVDPVASGLSFEFINGQFRVAGLQNFSQYAVVAVPEPSSAVVLLLMMSGSLFRPKRRRC